MSATLTTVNAILKEIYEGNINDQLNDERVVMKRIERTAEGTTSDSVGGKYVTFPVRTARNAGISYRAENTQLAAAGRQGLKSAQETLRYGYGRVRLTGQLIDLAETNRQAFSSAMDIEMDGLKNDLLRDENQIAVGHVDGFVGVRARATAASAGTTITVDTTQLLEEGMVISITDTSGVAVSGGTSVTITSITSDTVFVVSAAVAGTIIGSCISRQGNFNNEPFNLCRIVDSTGSLHQLDPATTPKWKSVEDGTTTTLTEMAMAKVIDDIRRAGGNIPTVIFTSLGFRRTYQNLMMSLRRYNEPKNFAGGLVGLSFMYGGKDLPLVDDVDIPAKHAFFIHEPDMKIWRDKPWHWQDRDGSVLKWDKDYDAWEALMKQYWQLGTHQRNSHGKMTNITETV